MQVTNRTQVESPITNLLYSHKRRKNGLPSKPHPVISELDEHMTILRDSQATSTHLHLQLEISSWLSKICMIVLICFFFCHSHNKFLAQEDHKKQVDELLDGSLRILDLCNITKDALLQSKDCIQQLQSVFLTRQGRIKSEIKKCICSRKNVEKTIKKVFKNMKNNENKPVLSSFEILTMMREVEAITINIFESFLSYISEPSKPSGWSIVSKLMHHKRVAAFSDEQEANQSEFATVDAVLESLMGFKTVESEEVQKKLHSLELCIQDLEDRIECLFRKMIKSRASFLNIFS